MANFNPDDDYSYILSKKCLDKEVINFKKIEYMKPNLNCKYKIIKGI